MAANEHIDLDRLSILLDAYGADRTRWPEAERAAAWALIEADDKARALYEDARALDGLLNQASTIEPSPELKAEVLAAASRPRESWIEALWPFGAAWKPASALAAAVLLGIIAGVVLPNPLGSSDEPIESEIGELAMTTVFDIENEQ
ncbi:MAG: hypothetical protein P8Z76_08105 [Alphaproteobacteria bacterium]